MMIMSYVFSMYSGIRNIPPIYNIKAAKNMGSRRFSLFRNVMLPAAMPSFMSGIRQAWSFAWHALIGAEILMTTIGLGAILYLGSEFARDGRDHRIDDHDILHRTRR
jgi:NitT/TauT family transport system permease protein